MCPVQDVIKRMMIGAKTAVRTELTAQLEEQGYIEQIMSLLKEKNTPMPMKVAGVEVLKVHKTDSAMPACIGPDELVGIGHLLQASLLKLMLGGPLSFLCPGNASRRG